MSHLQEEFHHPHQPKPRYPYQRIRNKAFPWGPCNLFDLECWRELKKQQQQGGGASTVELSGGQGGLEGKDLGSGMEAAFDREMGGGGVLAEPKKQLAGARAGSRGSSRGDEVARMGAGDRWPRLS
jgi:hypothetical protein